MSGGEGFGDGGGGFEGGAEGAGGAAETYAGFDGRGDALPSSTSPAEASRGHPGNGQRPSPSRHDQPPHSWSAEFHPHWQAVPEALRPYLHERERQAHEHITKLGGPAKAHGEITAAFERHGLHQMPQGLTHAKVIEGLLAAGRALKENPAAVLRHLAQVNGVDLRTLVAPDGSAQRTIAALQQEVATLRQAQAQFHEQAQRAGKQQQAENARRIAEAKRHQALNQTSGRGGTPTKTTLRDSLQRHADRLMR